MATVFRIRDYHFNRLFYVGSKPAIRKYLLENTKYHESIVVEEITWQYKNQLVNLLNETVSMGESLHFALVEQMSEGETKEEFVEAIQKMYSNSTSS